MIGSDNVGELFSLLRERFDHQVEELNALDSAVGDGDHGFTMSRTMRAAESATRSRFPDLGKAFDAAAVAVAEEGGGAIGPLLAAFFAEGGLAFASKDQLRLEDFRAFIDGALAAVQEVGGAGPGDKTLVDALKPAADALSNADLKDLPDALRTAAAAALQGAQNTTRMKAARGRASFAPERSLGHQDAGATSLALILAVFEDFNTGQRASETFGQEKEAALPPPGKLVNQPRDLVREDNLGLALLYPELVRLTPEGLLVRSHPKEAGKVGLVIGH